jgi:hypothetical protein
MEIPAASTQNNPKKTKLRISNKIQHIDDDVGSPRAKAAGAAAVKEDDGRYTGWICPCHLFSSFFPFFFFPCLISLLQILLSFPYPFFSRTFWLIPAIYFVIRRNMCNNLIHFNLKLFPVLTHTIKTKLEIENITPSKK